MGFFRQTGEEKPKSCGGSAVLSSFAFFGAKVYQLLLCLKTYMPFNFGGERKKHENTGKYSLDNTGGPGTGAELGYSRDNMLHYHHRHTSWQAVLTPFGRHVVCDKIGITSCLGNVLWILVFGIALFLESILLGAALCVTIVGIPFGLQHFKLAKLAIWPFGAKVI